MAGQKDDGRLDISLELKDRGLVASTNLKSIGVFDRLFSALFNRWTPDLERRPVVTETVTEGMRRLIEAAVNAGVKDIERRGVSYEDAAKLLASLSRPERNLTFVGLETVEELNSGQQREAPQSTLGLPEAENADETIDEDWLNYFESYAEKASSDNMRKLWARILAGKIRRPGSFSLRTLRIAAELDQITASQFSSLAECRYLGNCVLNPEPLEGGAFSMPSPADNIGELESAGLVDSAGGLGASLEYERPAKGIMALGVGAEMVVFHIQPGAQLNFPVYNLTRAGAELAHFVPINERRTIEILVAHASKVCDLITLNVTSATDKGRVASAQVKEALFRR